MLSELELEMPACCICSLNPFNSQLEDVHKFVIGTCHLTEANKLHVLEYRDDVKRLESIASWSCLESILEVSTPSYSPSSKQLLSTSSYNELRLLKIPEIISEQPEVVSIIKGWYHSITWNVEGEMCNCRFIFNDNSIVSIDVNRSDANSVMLIGSLNDNTTEFDYSDTITHAVSDPHHPSLLMCCTESGKLYLFDCRARKFSTVFSYALAQTFITITNISYSPSHMHGILSCHDDGCIQLHDLRYENNNNNILSVKNSDHINNTKQFKHNLSTRFTIQAHEHSVRKALFNPFHDELIVSASVDETVKLWDVNAESDRVTCISELHNFGDSVHDVTWSSNGPWVYAAVSFNGHVMVDSVPNNKRMSILLEENEDIVHAQIHLLTTKTILV